jgi:hypothetical protein
MDPVDRQAAPEPIPCHVYWGTAGCDLERGHDGPHRRESGATISHEEAFLFGEDLAAADLDRRMELWGE